MSVIKAILFYSKHDKKSMYLKSIIETSPLDLDTISVDSNIVKKRLMNDTQYNITRIPAILILYSTGTHKVYTGIHLDEWFEQLMLNLQAEFAQNQAPIEEEYTRIEAPVQMIEETSVPKELRRKPTNTSDIRSSLSSPGHVKIGGGTLPISGGEIGQVLAQPIDFNDPMIQPERKEVKKDGLTAKELAAKMQESRETYEEELEASRPFG